MSDSTQSSLAEFWARLRRRKVVQWGLVYVAGAWGFLQGLEYVSDAFQWSAQIRQIALFALLIGLPVVLVLAWYHGDRGQQRVTGSELAILVALFALGGAVLWWHQRVPGGAPPTPADTAAAPAQPAVLRVAVLPLENLSPDPENAYFADGLHEEILATLAQRGGMQLVSRTTMQGYRNTAKPVPTIGTELGASHLLEGSVRRSGDRVRLTLQLIDTQHDDPVWAQTYDRELRDALGLQTEVAAEVAAALNMTLGLGEQTRVAAADAIPGPTTKPEAYEAYLKARVLFDRLSRLAGPDEFRAVDELCDRAIQLDRQFPDPYTVRARAALQRQWFMSDLDAAGLARVRADIDTARRLAGDTAAVMTAEATYRYYGEMDYGRALETVRQALGRYPEQWDLRTFEALLLRRLGRLDEAIAIMQSLVEREPSNPSVVVNLTETLQLAERFKESVMVADAFARRTVVPDLDIAWIGATSKALGSGDFSALRAVVDAARQADDTEVMYTVETEYLRFTGRKQELATLLAGTHANYESASGGRLRPVGLTRGYGTLLGGSARAEKEGRELLATAERLRDIPGRDWNAAILEAGGALLLGDRRQAIRQALRARHLMPPSRDFVVSRRVDWDVSVILAWAGARAEAVQVIEESIERLGGYTPAQVLRDPLLTTPLAGFEPYEALRERLIRMQ